MKEYAMLPIKRPANAPAIQKVNPWAPIRRAAGAKQPEHIYYKIVKLSDDKKTATLCGDMTQLTNGELTVFDVSITILGPNAVQIGDVVAYRLTDAQFERPIITHRTSQQHQHPKYLIALNE